MLLRPTHSFGQPTNISTNDEDLAVGSYKAQEIIGLEADGDCQCGLTFNTSRLFVKRLAAPSIPGRPADGRFIHLTFLLRASFDLRGHSCPSRDGKHVELVGFTLDPEDWTIQLPGHPHPTEKAAVVLVSQISQLFFLDTARFIISPQPQRNPCILSWELGLDATTSILASATHRIQEVFLRLSSIPIVSLPNPTSATDLGDETPV